VTIWTGPTRLGPARIRLAQRGLARPALRTLCGPKTLARLRIPLGP